MRRQLVLWAALAALLVNCERWLTTCIGGTPCLASARAVDWLKMAGDAGGLLLAGAAVAFAVRTSWLLLACGREARQLVPAECPPALRSLARELGLPQLQVLAADVPMAFCAGALRPVIYVTLGVCTRLQPEQLRAVLLHELDHAERREPLRRAAMQAMSEVCFFLPVLDWLRKRRCERSELRADRRAIERLGPRAVAQALWALNSERAPAAFPAFAGAAGLRVAQLVGDPIPHRRPQTSLLAASVMGALFAVAIVNCAAEVAVFSLR